MRVLAKLLPLLAIVAVASALTVDVDVQSALCPGDENTMAPDNVLFMAGAGRFVVTLEGTVTSSGWETWQSHWPDHADVDPRHPALGKGQAPFPIGGYGGHCEAYKGFNVVDTQTGASIGTADLCFVWDPMNCGLSAYDSVQGLHSVVVGHVTLSNGSGSLTFGSPLHFLPYTAHQQWTATATGYPYEAKPGVRQFGVLHPFANQGNYHEKHGRAWGTGFFDDSALTPTNRQLTLHAPWILELTPFPEKSTFAPTAAPTPAPTAAPTQQPTASPTPAPTASPTPAPTPAPTQQPTAAPTKQPTAAPTQQPTASPTSSPTSSPTVAPTVLTQVDCFAESQARLLLESAGEADGLTAVVSEQTIVGGQRELSLTYDGQGVAAAEVRNGELSVGNSLGQAGEHVRLVITYDGADNDPLALDPTGLGGRDWSDRTLRFTFRVDIAFDLHLVMWTHAGAASTKVEHIVPPAGGSTELVTRDILVPSLSWQQLDDASVSAPADFTNIGAFQVIVDEFDLDLNILCIEWV